jgi:phage recombination protein Bet
MATAAKTKDVTAQVAPQVESRNELVPAASGSMKLRLPYPRTLEEYAGIDQRTWQVLIDAVWPSAKTVESVCLAISYCKSRNLDPLKRPIHIVPVWSKTGGPNGTGGEVETIWPGISELRTTAVRTGVYAGKDAAVFGPDITKEFKHVDDRNDAVKETATLTFPEWCQITVYRMVQGQRCAFVGPKVYWLEAYAAKSKFSEVPNDMWADRRSGQLEKCTEAAALRAAFPEELGNEYSAEEMYGKTIDAAPVQIQPTTVATPPRPQRSEFERPTKTPDKPVAPSGGSAAPTPSAPTPAEKPSAPRAENVTCTTCDEHFDVEPEGACPRCGNTGFAPVEDNTPAPQPQTPAETKPAAKPEPVVETEPPTASSAFEDWYKDQKAALEMLNSVCDVTDLQDEVLPQLSGDADKETEFNDLCNTRNKQIMAAGKNARGK